MKRDDNVRLKWKDLFFKKSLLRKVFQKYFIRKLNELTWESMAWLPVTVCLVVFLSLCFSVEATITQKYVGDWVYNLNCATALLKSLVKHKIISQDCLLCNVKSQISKISTAIWRELIYIFLHLWCNFWDTTNLNHKRNMFL